MPQFVPVHDPEKPRCEQSEDDPNMAKHRQFDNPHLNKTGAVRGSANERVITVEKSKQKLEKNKEGLWVDPNREEVLRGPTTNIEDETDEDFARPTLGRKRKSADDDTGKAVADCEVAESDEEEKEAKKAKHGEDKPEEEPRTETGRRLTAEEKIMAAMGLPIGFQ
eukprot:Platyproteum_vivax@DN2544_c0_g1_i1.p1